VGALLLYLLPSLSGSPVMRGEEARPPTSPPPLLTVGVSKFTTVLSAFHAGEEGSLAAFLATSSCARARGSLETSSPSGVGRGPEGTTQGFLSRESERRGRPRPARAQLTSCNVCLSLSATGLTRLSGGKMGWMQEGQVYPAGAVLGGKDLQWVSKQAQW